MVHKYPNINRLPDGVANINDTLRTVKIGYRSIGGAKVDAAVSALRFLFTGSINVGDTKNAPNPLCHWCVIVGNYYHELQATDSLNWYDNNTVGALDGWALYTVGETSFNDVAIKNAGMLYLLHRGCSSIIYLLTHMRIGFYAIDLMPEHYNIYNNNCQTFTVTLLDQICRAGRVRVTTSYATNQANYLPGMEADAEDGKVEVAVPLNGVEHLQFLDNIQDIMDQNTPALKQEDVAKVEALVKEV